MSLALVTAPAIEPITLAEAKAHCRVTSSGEDASFQEWIKSAREYCEQYTKRAIYTQTWDWTFDQLPNRCDHFDVPLPPLQSITHVKYYDTNGTQQTWTSTNYIVETPTHQPGRVALAYNAVWPTVQDRRAAIVVRFVAGYSSQANVPSRIKQAMKLLVEHQYRIRSPIAIGNITSDIGFTVDSLLQSAGWGCYA